MNSVTRNTIFYNVMVPSYQHICPLSYTNTLAIHLYRQVSVPTRLHSRLPGFSLLHYTISWLKHQLCSKEFSDAVQENCSAVMLCYLMNKSWSCWICWMELVAFDSPDDVGSLGHIRSRRLASVLQCCGCTNLSDALPLMLSACFSPKVRSCSLEVLMLHRDCAPSRNFCCARFHGTHAHGMRDWHCSVLQVHSRIHKHH